MVNEYLCLGKKPGHFETWDELAEFIIKNPKIPCVKTISVSNEVPYWQKSVLIDGPPEGEEFYIGFMCRNMPIDGKLRLTVPGPNEENSIDTGELKIRRPDMGIVYHVMWPPGFSSTAILEWWKGATTPPQGAEINIVVAYPKDKLMQSMPHLFEKDSSHHLAPSHRFLEYDSPAQLNSEEKEYIIMEGIQYKF